MHVRVGPHGGPLEATRNGRKVYPPVPFDDAPGAFTPMRNFIDAIHGKAELVSPVRYGVLRARPDDAMYAAADAESR
jgi:hypothetical protein